MKASNKIQKEVRNLIIFAIILLVIIIMGCKSKDSPEVKPIIKENLLSVSSIEPNSAIYLDGIYTGKVTPSEIAVSVGEHKVGVGLSTSKTYLRKTVEVKSDIEKLEVALNESDLQQPKTWKALFVGVNDVTDASQSCVSHYSTEQLDQAFDFFKWSFKEKVEPYSYHTMNWEFTRRDINSETVILSSDNLIAPDVLERYITDLNKGDYDLVVSFFNGEGQSCNLGGFIGIAWYSINVLNSKSSYYTIRYYNDIEAKILSSKQNDPGVFVHEWLHTVSEMFYPGLGWQMPELDGQVVHAAGKYNYTYPWMKWYHDLISGQVLEGSKYLGIGPDAFLGCTVSESALGQCQ